MFNCISLFHVIWDEAYFVLFEISLFGEGGIKIRTKILFFQLKTIPSCLIIIVKLGLKFILWKKNYIIHELRFTKWMKNFHGCLIG